MSLFTRKEKGSIIAASILACIIMVLASSGTAFASDDDSSLQERHVWFTYGYTECTETVHPLSKNGIYTTDSPDTEFPRNFTVNMMICDTEHVVGIEGDDVTNDKVTFESLNPSVLDVDNSGNVTLKKTGSAQIKATIAADDTYDECTANLYIKVDRHEAWAGIDLRGYYDDRPRAWGLDLDTGDGPHRIAKNLRPGASIISIESSDVRIAYVDQDGVVTPVSAGRTTILIGTDDGGGKYKASYFANDITITGDDVLLDQEITGDLGPFEIDNYRDGLQLDLHAKTDLEYYPIGADSEYVSVDQNGFVRFTQGASSLIHVVAPPDDTYKSTDVVINIVAYDRQGQLAKRDVRFNYGFTECDGSIRSCSDEGISHTGSSAPFEYFTTNMMICDTDHTLFVTGNGSVLNNVSLTSLDPSLLEIDDRGIVSLKGTGSATIKATIPGDGTYASCTAYLTVNIDRHAPYDSGIPVFYEGRAQVSGLNLDISDGPQRLVVPLRPGASVLSFTSDDPAIASIDENGVVTPVSAGSTVLRLTFDNGDGRYKTLGSPLCLDITVTGDAPRAEQKITGNLGPYTIDWHDKLALDLHAKTGIKYVVTGTGSPSVNSKGVVTFKGKGTATVKAVAVESAEYKSAEATIKITARDFAAEEAEAKQAAKKATLKKEISRAKSLKRASLKAKALKKHKIKLTWSKVKYADGYIVYIKYPGSKKYVKALTKNSTVKSVVHKGLSKGRIYRYKVRAFKKVNGKTYYGKYSKVRKVRAK